MAELRYESGSLTPESCLLHVIKKEGEGRKKDGRLAPELLVGLPWLTDKIKDGQLSLNFR